MNSTHNNPVDAGFLEKTEHYLYSRAKGYLLTKKCGLLDLVILQKNIFSHELQTHDNFTKVVRFFTRKKTKKNGGNPIPANLVDDTHKKKKK